MSKYGTVTKLGVTQTLAWASTYYLPAIIAAPMARDLDVGVTTVFAAFSAALLASAFLGPHAGRAIDRWGGRPVLTTTNLIFAAGLVLLGTARSSADMFLAWMVIGIAMGSGLYEAAFATLVRLYGAESRGAITGITLFAGFASTLGWPLTGAIETHAGWREACFVWAGLHLLLGLPLNALIPRPAEPGPGPGAAKAVKPAEVPMRSALLLTFAFAATWFVSTAMAAHLPRLLLASGSTLAAALAVGALIGPAQVAGRLLDFGLLGRAHPLLSARLAAAMHPVGAGVLTLFGVAAAPVFGVLHGAGNGILTIAKGTLPLALFGAAGYGHRQGLLMAPARVAQALAPWLFGLAMERWGSSALVLSSAIGLLAFGALMAIRTQDKR